MLSKTPSVSSEKTVSARKRLLVIPFLLVAGITSYMLMRAPEPGAVPGPITPRLCVQYGLEQIDPPICKRYAEVADTFEERTKGLGGRDSLAPGDGMVFVFDVPGSYCFWMKDMKFAIDIVWIDSDKKIQKLTENVTPDTYPQQYCSEGGTRYVLELNANTARFSGFEPGTIVVL